MLRKLRVLQYLVVILLTGLPIVVQAAPSIRPKIEVRQGERVEPHSFERRFEETRARERELQQRIQAARRQKADETGRKEKQLAQKRMAATTQRLSNDLNALMRIENLGARLERIIARRAARIVVEAMIREQADTATPAWSTTQLAAEIKQFDDVIRKGCFFTAPSFLEDCIQSVRLQLLEGTGTANDQRSLLQLLAESEVPRREQLQRVGEYARATGQRFARAVNSRRFVAFEDGASMPIVERANRLEAAAEFLDSLPAHIRDEVLLGRVGRPTKEAAEARKRLREILAGETPSKLN